MSGGVFELLSGAATSAHMVVATLLVGAMVLVLVAVAVSLSGGALEIAQETKSNKNLPRNDIHMVAIIGELLAIVVVDYPRSLSCVPRRGRAWDCSGRRAGFMRSPGTNFDFSHIMC